MTLSLLLCLTPKALIILLCSTNADAQLFLLLPSPDNLELTIIKCFATYYMKLLKILCQVIDKRTFQPVLHIYWLQVYATYTCVHHN